MDPPSATLYVLSAGYDNLYKVGRTNGVLSRRISQLNTGAARKLIPIASFMVPPTLICKCETFVHASLRDLVAWDAGGKEFFRCDDEKEFCRRVRTAWEEFSKFSSSVVDAVSEESRRDVPHLFDLRRGLASEMKQLEVRKTLIEDSLTAAFCEGFDLGAVSLLSWQKRSSERFDLDAFRKDHPELSAQYTRTHSSRTPVFH
jgi:Meiotically up-regulated gene 113